MTNEEVNIVLTDLMYMVAKQIQVESLYYTNTLYGDYDWKQRILGKHRLTKEQDTLIQSVSHFNHNTYDMLVSITKSQAVKQDLIKVTTETTTKIDLNTFLLLQDKLVAYVLQVLILLIPLTHKSMHTRLKGLASSTRGIQTELVLRHKPSKHTKISNLVKHTNTRTSETKDTTSHIESANAHKTNNLDHTTKDNK